jgi:hypothetical protein
VAEHGITEKGEYQAARDLLLRERPRIEGELLRRDSETALDAALRIAPRFVSGVLPIQGPPGSGKTYTGARMICALVQAGRKVGITANSHKVIRNLLDAVTEAADKLGIPDLSCIQKVSEEETPRGRLQFTTENPALFSAIGNPCQVAGGTAWLWARPEAMNAVDVLFVDEASQISLANIIAVSHAAPRIVLLGDPQQLNQPTQGSHPQGTDVSALDHVLNGEQTIPADRGPFLEETWRLHPSICAFTSELFYEGRLRSRPGLERQEVRSTSRISGAGLRYVPVKHEGNQSVCPEEVDEIRDFVREIVNSESTWTDRDGCERPPDWLEHELDPYRKIARSGLRFPRNDKHAHLGPALLYQLRELDTVERPRHVYVCQNSHDFGPTAKHIERLICVLRLGNPEPGFA